MGNLCLWGRIVRLLGALEKCELLLAIVFGMCLAMSETGSLLNHMDMMSSGFMIYLPGRVALAYNWIQQKPSKM